MSTRPAGAFRSPRQEVASQAWGGGYSAASLRSAVYNRVHTAVSWNTTPLAGSAGSSGQHIEPWRPPLNDAAGQMLSITTVLSACAYMRAIGMGIPIQRLR